MEQELQALKSWIDGIDPSSSSIDWGNVRYSLIVNNSLELFYTREELEARKLDLVMIDKNPNFTVHTHHD
jgi:hypothetical protein